MLLLKRTAHGCLNYVLVLCTILCALSETALRPIINWSSVHLDRADLGFYASPFHSVLIALSDYFARSSVARQVRVHYHTNCWTVDR